MGGQKPDWYERLNPNEKRIIDFFMETGWWFFISRAMLEKQLSKAGLMNSKTLTNRLRYLVDKGYLGKIKGEKGAVFYAPRFMVHLSLADPLIRPGLEGSVNHASPKSTVAIPMPIKIRPERVSDERFCELLVRAAETWERVGVGSERSKQKVYRDLRRKRRELKLKAEMKQESYDRSP